MNLCNPECVVYVMTFLLSDKFDFVLFCDGLEQERTEMFAELQNGANIELGTLHDDILKTNAHLVHKTEPYKHSTSSLLVGHWRTATSWQPADPHPLGGTEVGRKVGC